VITEGDYERCARQFCSVFDPLGEQVVSILLYGSMARGEIKPGKSDVLDAAVIFKDLTSSGEQEFYRKLDTMLQACQGLAESGLPHEHQFHYYTEDEFCHVHDPVFTPSWHTNECSSVLSGQDIRRRAGSDAIDAGTMRGAFFALRMSLTRDLASFLVNPKQPSIRRQAIAAIRKAGLYVATLACFACGADGEVSRAAENLAKLFPAICIEDLQAIQDFRKRRSSDISYGELSIAAKLTLVVIEQIHVEVTAWLGRRGERPRSEGSPPRVVILVSTCCFLKDISLYRDLAHALCSRNASVTYLYAEWDPCSYINRLPEPRSLHCSENRRETLRILSAGKVPIVYLNRYTPLDAECSAISDLPVSRGMCIREITPVWETIKTSVARFCEWQQLPDSPSNLADDEIRLSLRFARAARRYEATFRKGLEELAPTHVLLFNFAYFLERLAASTALSQARTVICSETSCFKDRRYLFRMRDLAEYRGGFYDGALAAISNVPKEDLASTRVFLRRSYEANGNSSFKQPAAHQSLRDRLGIDEAQRVALFIGQVPFDASVSWGEPYISVRDAITTAYRYFASRPGWFLVVRFHPGSAQQGKVDPLAGHLARLGGARNVAVVQGREVNTYQLMELASLGITISSQAGLEMLAFHKPVVVLGSAFYRGLGVTIDAEGGAGKAALDAGVAFTPDRHWSDKVDAVLTYWTQNYLKEVDGAGTWTKKGLETACDLFDCRAGVVPAKAQAGE